MPTFECGGERKGRLRVGDKGLQVLHRTTPRFVAYLPTMSRATALRRLMTEYKQLTTNGAPDNMFTAGPISEDDFFTWEAVIEGPQDTPFEGGVFVAKLEFVSPSIVAAVLQRYYPIGS